ncbi:hypothetical protein [Microcoleus sp. herbarium12]
MSSTRAAPIADLNQVLLPDGDVFTETFIDEFSVGRHFIALPSILAAL